MSWVDDESYVNERGKRLVNSWIKVPSDDSIDDPVKTVITGIILTAKAAS